MSDPITHRAGLSAKATSALCWFVLAGCSAPSSDRDVDQEPAQTDASAQGAQSADTGARRPSTARPQPEAGVAEAAPQMLPPSSQTGAATDGCGGASYVAKGKALEVLVLFDNSSSMILPAIRPNGEVLSLWDVAVTEMTQFCTDPRSLGISLALKYFGTECDPAFYSNPDVPMGTLPEHGAAIAESLRATLPLAETATRPALEGALAYLRERASGAAQDARQIVLLVTDGYPDEVDCPNNSTQAVSVAAAEGFASPQPVATYAFVTVTGVFLDDIAKAGGTGKTLLADLGRPGALADALASVRDQELAALPCEYDLPPAYFSEVNDPTLVNLMRDGAIVPHVEKPADCGADTSGWFYDDPQQPQRLLTCPATCASLKQAAAVEVQLSCPTVVLL